MFRWMIVFASLVVSLMLAVPLASAQSSASGNPNTPFSATPVGVSHSGDQEAGAAGWSSGAQGWVGWRW